MSLFPDYQYRITTNGYVYRVEYSRFGIIWQNVHENGSVYAKYEDAVGERNSQLAEDKVIKQQRGAFSVVNK